MIPPKIIPIPDNISPTATKDAINSGANIPILSNQGASFSGGSGNFPQPCRKKDIPSVILTSKKAIFVKKFDPDFSLLSVIFINYFLFIFC